VRNDIIFDTIAYDYTIKGDVNMKIVSIEPTPSPHSMKINVNEELPDGETLNVKKGDDLTDAPSYIKELFTIEGIINIYRVVDFITIARQPRARWEDILPAVRDIIGTTENEDDLQIDIPLTDNDEADDAFGEVKVFIQMFRNIPMQVKLENEDGEHRFGLPERFSHAIMTASTEVPTFIMERKWVEQSHVRYGEPDDIGNEVVEEIAASYDEERVNHLVELAIQDKQESESETKYTSISLDTLDDPDWRVRYAALDRLDPNVEHLEALDKALDDSRSSIRRLAAAYLGMIEDKRVLPYIYKALKDKSANVRRTAGDCASDLGYTEATEEMIKTLKDDNRIVRWRAAMFLFEVGDESSVPALEEALKEEPEFEVRMQINMALERIKGGEEAKGSIWAQMTEATKKD